MTDKLLLCPPDFYGIEYEINPWMNMKVKADHETAVKQWLELYDVLKNKVKADIEIVEPQKDVPDMVFTANAALMHNNTAVISRFRHPQRQPEEKYFAAWFEQNGYDVKFLPENVSFEGAGDALFSEDVLFAGYVPRTDITSHAYISDLLKIRVISLELTDNRFYHLDTCFCPLSGGYVMYFPDAFDSYGNKVIESMVSKDKRILVTNEEAVKFSCNAVNVEKNVVMNISTDRLERLLNKKGFRVYQTDLSEFMKAGGSSKCLTLKL
jgi:N-dimethylarginine dimethylaminohydrolase